MQLAAPPIRAANPQAIAAKKQFEGWSPSKVESLKFFLSKAEPSEPKPAANTCTDLIDPSAGLQASRPYLGLKYLLRQGPGGSGMPQTWKPQQGGALTRHALPPTNTSKRYAPYALPPPGGARARCVCRRWQYGALLWGLKVQG